jgi:hypothetical protein
VLGGQIFAGALADAGPARAESATTPPAPAKKAPDTMRAISFLFITFPRK